MVVIDEQHRFGVEQRAALREKGPGQVVPDVLVMTATPIPRTAAMTVYGDLDTTVLDELPPGRTPIATRWARGPLEEQAAWERVRSEVAAGHQAYVVCPLIEESERVQARSAAEERDRLGGRRAGRPAARAAARAAARPGEGRGDGRLPVGPDRRAGGHHRGRGRRGRAERHGDGHRGCRPLRDRPAPPAARPGRAGRPAVLVLPAGRQDAARDAEARLPALERSTDGFELAEVDLELRGEGTILGTRQKGATDLKLASLRRDKALVATAREVAFDLVDADPGLDGLPDLADEIRFLVDDEDRDFLFKS